MIIAVSLLPNGSNGGKAALTMTLDCFKVLEMPERGFLHDHSRCHPGTLPF
jgi:hypothetical protein